MNETLSRLDELDLLSLSQALYAFYRIAEHIYVVGIQIPEISKVLNEFQNKLEETKSFRKQENKALSTVLLFMKEFLYDDVMFLSTLVDVKSQFELY